MRRSRRTVKVSLGILVCLIMLCIPVAVWAVLAKTSTETIGDAWQAVAATTLVVGDAVDVSATYACTLCVEMGYIEAGDTAGAVFHVEVSNDANNWMELTSWTSVIDATVATDTIVDASCTAGDATLITTAGASDEFDVIDRTWLIWDANTVANSEICTTKSWSTQTATMCSVLTHNHPNNCPLYDRAETKLIALPMSARQVRVRCYNSDADIDCAFQYSVLKTTGL